jgi:hypothetical protein
MDVNLSPEIEDRVKDELAAGEYRDVNQFVESAGPSMRPAFTSGCSFQAGNERRPTGRS